MSSNVSENIVAKRSIAVANTDSAMPTPPIHSVSFVPMASRAGLKFPICGLRFTVYPFDAKMSRSSSKLISFACVVGCGCGMDGAKIFCILGAGCGFAMLDAIPMRGGRCNFGATGRVGTDGASLMATSFVIVGADSGCCGCVFAAMRARLIPMRRRSIPRGRISTYNTPNEINIAHVNDM